MIVEAVTFLVASSLHLTVEWEPQAAIPEALIGVVLLVGAAFVLLDAGNARAVALTTSGFAVLGTCLGAAITLAGGQLSLNLAYHAVILTTLIVSLVLMARPRRVTRSDTPNVGMGQH